jgi:hypothetical protein
LLLSLFLMILVAASPASLSSCWSTIPWCTNDDIQSNSQHDIHFKAQCGQYMTHLKSKN